MKARLAAHAAYFKRTQVTHQALGSFRPAKAVQSSPVRPSARVRPDGPDVEIPKRVSNLSIRASDVGRSRPRSTSPRGARTPRPPAPQPVHGPRADDQSPPATPALQPPGQPPLPSPCSSPLLFLKKCRCCLSPPPSSCDGQQRSYRQPLTLFSRALARSPPLRSLALPALSAARACLHEQASTFAALFLCSAHCRVFNPQGRREWKGRERGEWSGGRQGRGELGRRGRASDGLRGSALGSGAICAAVVGREGGREVFPLQEVRPSRGPRVACRSVPDLGRQGFHRRELSCFARLWALVLGSELPRSPLRRFASLS
ncbi:hypothetical protein MPTK1_4g03490 [Marchantia polymorpha subsp. ruderalis]|uniref:Uncharacterized protein n=2 Tax=Marchantia polymorpha TaxID=3197 RepID=A0AAF6B5V9_MARPO|nr:hypothetical protein MARPO_0044s0124 [Marchantia polymorpha]BBN07393.1 hypothetical protein Mp_4g03490 [Marchantia polymorpha subsp. ruderalis]|eukprot:PTQ39708.1 hypothetical protein MARPO_0044s0124 [Marchantia polymorpha]